MTEIITAGTAPLVVDRSPELMRGAGRTGGGPPIGYGRLIAEDVPGLAEVSEPGDGESCLLANFLRRQLPGCEPHIEGEHPYVNWKGTCVEVLLEPEIVERIGRYDRGETDAFAGADIWFTLRGQ